MNLISSFLASVALVVLVIGAVVLFEVTQHPMPEQRVQVGTAAFVVLVIGLVLVWRSNLRRPPAGRSKGATWGAAKGEQA